MRLIIQNN